MEKRTWLVGSYLSQSKETFFLNVPFNFILLFVCLFLICTVGNIYRYFSFPPHTLFYLLLPALTHPSTLPTPTSPSLRSLLPYGPCPFARTSCQPEVEFILKKELVPHWWGNTATCWLSAFLHQITLSEAKAMDSLRQPIYTSIYQKISIVLNLLILNA